MIRSLLLCATLAGCATQPVDILHEPLTGPLTTPYNLAQFPDGFEMDGVTGDERVIFTGIITPAPTQPVAVLAAARLSGNPIGSLTPPPDGFLAIAAVKVLGYRTSGISTSGTLLVVDVGALPPASHSTLYRYSYSYSPLFGFSSELLDSHTLPVQSFPPVTIDGVGYAGDVALLPGGGIAIADGLDGAIWTCGPTLEDCHLSQADPAWGAAPAPPSFSGIGRAQGGGTKPYTLGITGGLMPGLLNIDYAAKTDEVCGLTVAPPGGLYCVDRAQLLDDSISPFAKSKRVLVAPQTGVTDGGHGVAFDHWHPTSPWFYWVRSLADDIGGGSNIVRRVNLLTGEVQEVAESLTVMDFSTGLSTIPPLVGGSPFTGGSSLTNLAVAMGQEENNAVINPVLSGVSMFVTPSIIAGIVVSSH